MTGIRLVSLLLVLLVASCGTPSKPKEPPRPTKQSKAATDIDTEADRLLALMSKSLQSTGAMSFTARITYEEVLASGLKVERHVTANIKARRPDCLRVEFDGAGDQRLLTCDGKTVTLVEKELKLYGSCPAAANLDQTLDLIADDHGIVVPCADYLFSNPYAVLSKNAGAGSYLGLETIQGVKAHHLVFSQKGLDWQIWIDSGPRALPLRTVLTYVDVKGAPRFEADLSNWNLAPTLTGADFTASVAGMERIEFQSSTDITGRDESMK